MSDTSRIDHWLANPLGQTLLEAETRAAGDFLAGVFGFQSIQVGRWGASDQFALHSRTQSFALLSDKTGDETGEDTTAAHTHIVSPPSALAIGSGSVDAVILPHTLEIDPDPHQVLREAERVLGGEGHLLVLCFNPTSLWGLRHRLSRSGFPPAVERMVSEFRLRDWLRLLGFEVLCARGYCAGPPGNGPDWLRRSWVNKATDNGPLKMMAGAYCLLAKKSVITVTPIKSKLARRRRVLGGLAEPTTRNPYGDSPT